MFYLFLFWVLILLSANAGAQPAVGTVFTASTGGDVSGLTISSVAVSGSNRGLVVCSHEAAANAGVGVSTITFNTSESFTFVEDSLDGERETEFWYLVNPTATTADVVITLSGSGGSGTTLLATAFSLTGVAQSQPPLSNNAECSSCTTETVDLTTTIDETLLLACGKHNNDGVSWTHGDGQTELSDFGESTGAGESMTTSYELKDPAGLETLESTATSSGVIGLLAIGVEPFVAPSASRRRTKPVVFQ